MCDAPASASDLAMQCLLTPRTPLSGKAWFEDKRIVPINRGSTPRNLEAAIDGFGETAFRAIGEDSYTPTAAAFTRSSRSPGTIMTLTIASIGKHPYFSSQVQSPRLCRRRAGGRHTCAHCRHLHGDSDLSSRERSNRTLAGRLSKFDFCHVLQARATEGASATAEPNRAGLSRKNVGGSRRRNGDSAPYNSFNQFHDGGDAGVEVPAPAKSSSPRLWFDELRCSCGLPGFTSSLPDSETGHARLSASSLPQPHHERYAGRSWIPLTRRCSFHVALTRRRQHEQACGVSAEASQCHPAHHVPCSSTWRPM